MPVKLKLALAAAIAAACIASPNAGFTETAKQPNGPVLTKTSDGLSSGIVGMYIHQHWPYNFPYAARTWSVEDYRDYCKDLKSLGFNSVMIWPQLETMPNPMTPSDEANVEKIAKVIDVLKNELGMLVYITLCPNVGAKDEIAAKSTFEDRHYFYSDTRVNPADEKALQKLIDIREGIFRKLKNADGVVIIDSDPGGYPGSNNKEFVNLLKKHRIMLDKVRPGIELVYWIHVGWPGYCRWYSTGNFAFSTEDEYVEAIDLASKAKLDPWGIANGLKYAEKLNLQNRVMAYNYGAIEYEPSLPLTRYDYTGSYTAGNTPGPRGVMGNAQTHCMQLPNTFAFSRGVKNQPVEQKDFVEFANELIPGQGELIAGSWEALATTDSQKILSHAKQIRALDDASIKSGKYPGLLFNNPLRFMNDLAMQLELKGNYHRLDDALRGGKKGYEELLAFTNSLDNWQRQTGYKNGFSNLLGLKDTLLILKSKPLDEVLSASILAPEKEEGNTPFEKVCNGLAREETYTLRLIAALRETLKEMRSE